MLQLERVTHYQEEMSSNPRRDGHEIIFIDVEDPAGLSGLLHW
jgi:hypothetical protein